MIERADVDFQSLYMRFYFDEDVSVDIAANLQQRGFDVLTVRNAGRLQLDNAAQLAFAVATQRVMVTHNREDFELLHASYLAEQQLHSAIIIIAKRRPNDDLVAGKLLRLLDTVTSDAMQNQLRYI